MSVNSDRAVKITPEMLDAGVEILIDSEWGWTNPREFARRLYLAMDQHRQEIFPETRPLVD
jgi:hypothetical protein